MCNSHSVYYNNPTVLFLSQALRQSLQGIYAIKAGNQFEDFIVFRLEMMLKPVVVFDDKLFCPYDARVGKVSCTVSKPVNLVYLKIPILLS